MHTPIRIMAAILFLAVAPPLAAQGFGRPTATWDHEFSRLGGIAELPDGRVVIVDNLDGLVFVGAAGGGAITQLGQAGDGPDEYRGPWSAIRWLGDTVLVYAASRLVRVTPSGIIAGSLPFVARTLGGVAPPRGVDREGRLYWDRPVIRDPRSGGLKRQQRYEIVRIRPGRGQAEVVATASDHAPELHDHRFHPFAQRDAWVVDPEGTVRIVRARTYAVDAVQGGKVVSAGAPLSFQAVRIDAADREAYRHARAANAPRISFGGPSSGGGGVTPARLAQMREAYPDEIFPAHKPPFIDGGVHRSPAGQLWVVRSPGMGASHPRRIDVLDAAGRRIRELDVPAGRSLLGLDRRGIYLVREDADGLQYLERYAWPAGLR